MYNKVCWYIVQPFFKDKKWICTYSILVWCYVIRFDTPIFVLLYEWMSSISASLVPQRVDEIVQLLSSNCLILSLAFQLSLFNRNLSLSLSSLFPCQFISTEFVSEFKRESALLLFIVHGSRSYFIFVISNFLFKTFRSKICLASI